MDKLKEITTSDEIKEKEDSESSVEEMLTMLELSHLILDTPDISGSYMPNFYKVISNKRCDICDKEYYDAYKLKSLYDNMPRHDYGAHIMCSECAEYLSKFMTPFDGFNKYRRLMLQELWFEFNMPHIRKREDLPKMTKGELINTIVKISEVDAIAKLTTQLKDSILK